MPEGNYVVGSNPQDFNPYGRSFGDHTTGTGLMLIANGSPTPNTVLWQETVNAATLTSYVFSGWAASWGESSGNGIDPSPAELEFFVNGVQIGSEFTLNAQDGQWSQFSATWSSATSGSATITIVDMNTATGGNDFAVDDLAFSTPQAAYPPLVVTSQPPASVTAGSDFGFTVTTENASGGVDTSFNGTVTVALLNNPGGASLGGTLTTTADNGVATFSDLTLNKVGSGYTLSVSANGLTSATTDGFNVTPAAANQLVVSSQPPGSVFAGSPFGLTVAAEDPYGNVDTNFGSGVTVALLSNPGGATLGGTLTATAQKGVATFSGLTVNEGGNGYTLEVTSDGVTAATTNAFNVTVPQLVVTSQPADFVGVGASFGLAVTAEDSSGNVDSSFDGTVTVALSANPGGATLGGTISVTAQNGVATFSDLTLDKAGTGYTLLVTANGVVNATTDAFDVGTTIYTVNAITDTGTGSGTTGDLLYCINLANANPNTLGSLIEFDPTVFATPQTITLTSTLTLSETAGPEVIDGPGANLRDGQRQQ